MTSAWLLLLACAATGSEDAPIEAAPAAAPAAAGAPHRAEEVAPPAAAPELEVVVRVLGPDRPELTVAVAVHGLGDRPETFGDVFLRYPGGLRLLLPRAPTPWGRGGTWFPSVRGGLDNPELVAGVRTAADQVAAWLGSFAEAHPEAPLPVITGFSQGGIVSFAVAVLHPERVARAVPMGGLLPPSLWPQQPVPGAPPVRALHGADDTVVPCAVARDTVRALAAVGIDATLREYADTAHSVPAAMRRDLHALVAGRTATGGALTAP